MARDPQELETREVRVDDPALSEAANQALTDELRATVGADEVQVPVGTPQLEHDIRGARRGAASVLGTNRLLIAVTGVAAIVVGAIIALASDQWWVLFLPVGVHAIGTFLVGFMAIRITTQPESPDPTLTAMLEDEGVPAPESVFNELVQEFSGAEGTDPTDVVTTGDNSDDAHATAEPAKAAVQHASAMTPAEGATEPAGEDDFSLVIGFQWVIIIALALTSVIAAFVVEMGWLLALVMLPTCGAFAAYQVIAKRRADSAEDKPATRRRVALTVLAAVLAIEALTLVVVVLGTR